MVGVPGVLFMVQGIGEMEEAVPRPVRLASERQSQAHVAHHTVNCAFLPPQVISLTQPGVSLCPKAWEKSHELGFIRITSV